MIVGPVLCFGRGLAAAWVRAWLRPGSLVIMALRRGAAPLWFRTVRIRLGIRTQ
jgi:hypothetical protein